MHPAESARSPESDEKPTTRRRGSTARDSLFNLLGTGLPLVIAVFTIPPIALGLGSERFGLLGLVWVVLAYFNLLDLGLGRAATKYGADALARGDMASLRGVAWTAARVQFATGLCGALATVLIAPVLAHRVFDAAPALAAETIGTFYALAVAAPVVALTTTFRGLLEAGRRFDVVNLVRAPVSASNFLLPLLALAGWSMPALVASMVAVRGVALVVYAAACLRLWPELRTVHRPLTVPAGLVRFGGWLTVSAIVSPLLVYVDRFVIGGLIGMAAVGFYTAPHEIVMRLEIVPGSIVAALFPAFARTLAAGGSAAADAGRAMRYLLLLIGPPAIALALLGPDVLALWIGPDHARAGGTVLRLLAIGMLFNAMAYVPSALIQAAGRADVTARFHLLELFVHVPLLLAATARFGLAGAAGAWMARMALDAGLLFVAGHRLRLLDGSVLRDPRGRRAIGWLAAFTVAAGIAAAVGDAPSVRVLLVSLVGVAWMPLAFAFGVDARERAQAIAAVTRRPA